MKVNEFFGFDSSPFSRNIKTIYESKDYLEISKRLDFFIGEDGVALITGLHGLGKTMIVDYLLDRTDKVVYIQNNDLSLFEFFNYLGKQLDVKTNHCHMSSILADIDNRVLTYNNAGKKVILVIDDVDDISYKVIESLKYLYETRRDKSKGMSILLLGHSSFRARCKDPRFSFLINNIIINYDCVGLSLNETKEYIKHRLRCAGSNEQLIDDKYFNTIYSYTEGNPGVINKYMSTVLLVAYVNKTKEIDGKILKIAKDEMEI